MHNNIQSKPISRIKKGPFSNNLIVRLFIIIACILFIVTMYTPKILKYTKDEKREFIKYNIQINKTKKLNYKVGDMLEHDESVFVQGFEFHNDLLYESGGLYRQSHIRVTNITTNEILSVYKMPNDIFAEGLTIMNDRLWLLCWQKKRGWIFNVQGIDFILEDEFNYNTQGWGITNDGNEIFMSDGSHKLYNIDPITKKQTFKCNVKMVVKDVPDNVNIPDIINDQQYFRDVHKINELEYINGLIYANVWYTDSIILINPDTCFVEGIVDLNEIVPKGIGSAKVLNGIGFRHKSKELYVTGKLWPMMYIIELEE